MSNVFWITGLSCSGKTTIGKMLCERLRAQNRPVVFLDGDELRKLFGNDSGYSRTDREKCAMRNARLCSFLGQQGLDVICCTISMFHSVQEWNREHIPDYVEIYVKSPMDILKKRDYKGIYSGSSEEVAGVSVAVEEPENPDIVLLNDEGASIPDLVTQIENYIVMEGVKCETR